jgi:hypothetical protein
MTLIRTIILAIEDDKFDDVYSVTDKSTIVYHMALLIEAGLLIGETYKTDGEVLPVLATYERLTWKGHDFADAIRNEGIWKQANEVIGKVGNASFEIWVQVLLQIVQRSLGLSS